MVDAVIETMVEKLNVLKAMRNFEDRGEASDIILGIMTVVGLVVSTILGVIMFVKFSASPEFFRAFMVSMAVWMIPTMVGSSIEDNEDEDKTDALKD